MGLFDSLADLTKNVASVVVAPVEIAADVANAAVKPIKELTDEMKHEVKDLVDG